MAGSSNVKRDHKIRIQVQLLVRPPAVFGISAKLKSSNLGNKPDGQAIVMETMHKSTT